MTPSASLTDFPSHLLVRVPWAAQHEWAGGETLAQTFQGSHALWLLQAGELHVESATSHFTLHPGDALLWPPDTHRILRAGNGNGALPGARWLTLGVRAQLFGHLDILQLLPAPLCWRPSPQEYLQLNTLAESIIGTSDTTTGILLRDGLCRALVAHLWQMLRKDDLLLAAREALPDWLQKVLTLAQSQPGVGVAELARIAAFSPAQFRRAFAHWMQLSPRDYLQKQRLELARNLLENSELPVGMIAEQLHFANTTHFGRAWKKQSGISPAAYRKQVRSSRMQL